jgi:hypothetical protein
MKVTPRSNRLQHLAALSAIGSEWELGWIAVLGKIALSGVMPFERQRLLLTLLDAAGGLVGHTDFQKLLSLYTQARHTMNDIPPSDTPPSGRMDLPPEWPSLEAFTKWTQENPEGLDRWETVMRRVGLGEDGDLTPEVREAAAKFVTLRSQQRALAAVSAKLRELVQVMQAPPGAYAGDERLMRINALFEEVTDLLLDVPEPRRTRFFGVLAPLRERVKVIEREHGS